MTRKAERGSVFRMASFRLAVLGTLFSTLAAVTAFALLYGATYRATRATYAPQVEAARAALLAQAHTPRALEAAVAQDALTSSFLVYALTDAAGHQTAGNIPMPNAGTGLQVLTRWTGTVLPVGVKEVAGEASLVPGGGTLFIGADATVFAQLNRQIAYLFAGVFGVTLGFGLLTSLVIAFYSLKRVLAISETSREIIAGDLSRRVKLYGTDDELDVLTAELNEMLTTVEGIALKVR